MKIYIHVLISTSNIFARNSEIVSSFEFVEFSSKNEGSFIGQKISTSDSYKRFVHLNKVGTSDVVLSDEDGNETNTFIVNQTLSTSRIDSKYTSNGSNVSFDIVSDIKDNTKIKIVLNNEEAEIQYKNGSFNEFSSDNKIKKIYSDGNKIFVEFDNLEHKNIFFIKYP